MAAAASATSSRGIASSELSSFYRRTKKEIKKGFPSTGVTALKIHLLIVFEEQTYLLDKVISAPCSLHINLPAKLTKRICAFIKKVPATEDSVVDVKLDLFWKTLENGISRLRINHSNGISRCHGFGFLGENSNAEAFYQYYKIVQLAIREETLKVFDQSGNFITEN